jgi:predicted secreted hydrolase
VKRRTLLQALKSLPALGLAGSPMGWLAARAGTLSAAPLRFPRDFGAHPEQRTEWWYLTGELQAASAQWGFQITFFRSRVDVASASRSAFAVKQLVFAHTALTDLAGQRLLHDQRIARTGFGLAQASELDTALTLRDWQLRRSGPAQASVYASTIAARDFALDLRFAQTQPLLLQGEQGYSRKGPHPEQASRYYSQPQLQVSGTLQVKAPAGGTPARASPGQTLAVTGRAWLDHEWSDELLDRDAVGWDWIGMNLADGSALTAFRLRRRDGSALWSGGSWRAPGQPVRAFADGEVRFTPGRIWTSPATGARYPVEWVVALPGMRFTVRARLDAQELDSRASTGSVYWEGLSALFDASGQAVGRGYLEMTGYAAPMAI